VADGEVRRGSSPSAAGRTPSLRRASTCGTASDRSAAAPARAVSEDQPVDPPPQRRRDREPLVRGLSLVVATTATGPGGAAAEISS
jgi:hypothetical protein